MTTIVLRTTLRELLRRRTALALTLLLPLAFYLVRLDTHWTALRLLSMGLGWAAATLSLFTHVSARNIDRRLSVAGASPTALFAGRQFAIIALESVVVLVYFGLVAFTIGDKLERVAPVVLMLALAVVVAVPLGALVAALVPRDLEGALLLLIIMGVQLLVDPAEDWTRILPLWSTRELATYVIEDTGVDPLINGLAHGLVTAVILWLAAWVLARLRLSTRRVPEPVQPAPSVVG